MAPRKSSKRRATSDVAVDAPETCATDTLTEPSDPPVAPPPPAVDAELGEAVKRCEPLAAPPQPDAELGEAPPTTTERIELPVPPPIQLKRPRTKNAFMLYSEDNRGRVKTEYNMRSATEVAKKLGEESRSLEPARKDAYVKAAKDLLVQHAY